MSLKIKIIRIIIISFITTCLTIICLNFIKMTTANYDVDDCMLTYIDKNNATGGILYDIEFQGAYHVEGKDDSLMKRKIGYFDGCIQHGENLFNDILNTSYCYQAKTFPQLWYLFSK